MASKFDSNLTLETRPTDEEIREQLKNGNWDYVKALINFAEGSVDAPFIKGNSILYSAAYWDPSGKIVGKLLEVGANPSFISPNGTTPLHNAVYFGHTEVVKIFCNKRVNLEVVDSVEGRTALNIAAIRGHPEIIRVLIKAGANKEHKDNEDKTPLALAIETGKEDAINSLATEGCNLFDPSIKKFFIIEQNFRVNPSPELNAIDYTRSISNILETHLHNIKKVADFLKNEANQRLSAIDFFTKSTSNNNEVSKNVTTKYAELYSTYNDSISYFYRLTFEADGVIDIEEKIKTITNNFELYSSPLLRGCLERGFKNVSIGFF